MRLKCMNVERIAETEEQITKLKAKGFLEMEPQPQPETAPGPGQIGEMSLNELKELARQKGLDGYASLTKAELRGALKDVVS